MPKQFCPITAKEPQVNMPKARTDLAAKAIPILPLDAPVEMPELPPTVAITTLQQFKAISHTLRTQILAIIQHQPTTAKQIAERLKVSTGSVGHHLKLLEEAGLAQVVAKRVTNGIIAKYYARTGKMFNFELPPELVSPRSVTEDIIGNALADLHATLDEKGDQANVTSGYPRRKLTAKQLAKYQQRMHKLLEDFLNEPVDPQGVAVGLVYAMFELPSYVQ